MSSTSDVTSSPETNSASRLTGRVKWFNNKAGYGFVTITDGDKTGTDIFVHHSAVQVSNQQYKYLVQGEYVEFKLIPTQGGAHDVQAADVGGIKGGKLMCETRREFRITRSSYKVSSDRDEVSEPVRPPRSVRTPVDDEQHPPRVRGSGPRDGGEWKVVKPTKDRVPVGGRGRGRPPRSTEEKKV